MGRFVLVVLLALGVAVGAAPAGAAPGGEPELQRALDAVVAAGVPGAVARVRDGDRTIRLASGHGNLKPRAAMRPDDRFRVGSITKTFVATVVLQLVGEGRLALSDTVERRLPGVVPNGRRVTVRQLLDHTSGLFDYRALLGGRLLSAELLREMETMVTPAPGFSYGLGLQKLRGPCGTFWGRTGGCGKAAASPLQRSLDELVAAGGPGALALVRDGDRTTRVTSGYGNLAPRTPMRAGDRFRIASVTKPFVATVVLQLVAEGKLSLDDTVERRLPGLVPNGRGITVRQLLNMTAGLFDYLMDGDRTVMRPYLAGNVTYAWKPRRLVEIAVSHPPRFAPGAGWSYCNTCYIVLGLIVEATTGRPLATELRQRIFAPLHLRGTTFDTAPRIAGRYVHGYELDGTRLADVSVLSPSFGWAAGAIVSTADDVARFFRALLGGRLLPVDLVRAMETTVDARSLAPGVRYGLGLARVPLPCGVAWGHVGGTPGYGTWALSSKDGRRQIVVLVNREESLPTRASVALERAVATAYCKEKP